MLRGAVPVSISAAWISFFCHGAPYALSTVSIWSVSSDLHTANTKAGLHAWRAQHLLHMIVCIRAQTIYVTVPFEVCLCGEVHASRSKHVPLTCAVSADNATSRSRAAITDGRKHADRRPSGISCMMRQLLPAATYSEGCPDNDSLQACMQARRQPAAHPGVVSSRVLSATVFGAAWMGATVRSRQQAAAAARAAIRAMVHACQSTLKAWLPQHQMIQQYTDSCESWLWR
jgi:hypothetical protein